MSINADEAYDAFAKGTLDICPGSTDSGVTYGFADVAKNFKEGPFLGAVGGLVMMNLDVYNSLPADVKGILADLEKESVAQHLKIRDTLMAGYTAKLKQGGVKFTAVSAAEEKRMLEICDSVIESYLTKDMEKIGKGTEGRALLAALRKVRIDYQAFLKTPEGQKWLEPKN